MGLAQTIIERNFTDHAAADSLPITSFVVDMNDLFERLVRQLVQDIYKRQDPTYRVSKKPVGHIVKKLPENTGFGTELPPDVVISKSGTYQAVMNAKWTMKGPQIAQFYQMVAYMTMVKVDTGVLVYPTLTGETQEFFTKAGKKVRAIGVPIEETAAHSQPAFETELQSIFERR